MATQLVIQNNRVLAHGTDCFICMGGTVVCTVSGRVFQNASVVVVDCPVPTDIDSGGYEYKGGCFYPCSRVLPDTAEALGLAAGATIDDAVNALRNLANSKTALESGTYTGTGTCGTDNPTSLTFDFEPQMVILGNPLSYSNAVEVEKLVLFRGDTSVQLYNTLASAENGTFTEMTLDVSWDGNTVSWSKNTSNPEFQLNAEGVEYRYMAFGTGSGGSGVTETDPAVTAISTVLSGTTMTFTETLEDGSTNNIVVTLDDNGVPTGMTVNGSAVGVTMEGF